MIIEINIEAVICISSKQNEKNINIHYKKINFLCHVCDNCLNYFNVAFHLPTIPTGCSLDGWFDLIEVVAGTVALVGTVKGRFIFFKFST